MNILQATITGIALCFISVYANSQNGFFKAVTVVSSSPLPSDGAADSSTIFYTSDMVIFKIHNHYSTSSFSPDEEGNLTKGKLIETGETVSYFVYDPQKKYGIMFNTIIPKSDTVGDRGFLNDTIRERSVLIDSFLKRHPNFQFDFRKINTDSTELIKSSDEKYNYIETYRSKFRPMGISGDSLILYYNKNFMDIEYELAKTKKNILPYKLQKIRIVYNLEGDKPGAVKSFKVERFFELRKVNVKEFEEAAYYYNLAKSRL